MNVHPSLQGTPHETTSFDTASNTKSPHPFVISTDPLPFMKLGEGNGPAASPLSGGS